MKNNDILRRLRYALSENDARMVELFALSGHEVSIEQVHAYMGKEEEDDTVYCPNDLLAGFLDALILDRRGPPKTERPKPGPDAELSNNLVLKKLRIALTLHEEDMLDILKAGEQPLSKSELSALFRKPDHKHYRECGDQVLRNFLKGLTMRYRYSKS